MSQELDRKSIVIIGGTSGLGLSAARAFTAAGARVVAVGKEPDRVEAAREILGTAALVLAADATDPKCALAAIQVAVNNFGGFHGLYHVAGGSGRRMGDGPLHELTDEGWRYTLEQNLDSLFFSNRAAVQQFIRQKSGGAVLNISSVLAFSPAPDFFGTHAYAAAKSAVIGFTKAAAATYAHQGIRLNVIAPGLVATPMSGRAQGNSQIAGYLKTKQPLDGGRIGEPSDLDAAAVFFMSDASRFVTGQVLAVDGGWSVSEGQVPLSAAPPAATTGQPAAGLFKKLAGLGGKFMEGLRDGMRGGD